MRPYLKVESSDSREKFLSNDATPVFVHTIGCDFRFVASDAIFGIPACDFLSVRAIPVSVHYFRCDVPFLNLGS